VQQRDHGRAVRAGFEVENVDAADVGGAVVDGLGVADGIHYLFFLPCGLTSPTDNAP
jgi:hypothetical protein